MKYIEDAKKRGFTDVTWKRVDNRLSDVIEYEVSYRAQITDRGKDGFSWTEIVHNGISAYKFEFHEYLTGFRKFTLTLHAGKVLESNGRQINDGTVVWENPYQLPYAVVIPRSPINWIPLIGAGVLSVVTLGTALSLAFTGRLRKWGEAGLSAGKWKAQLLKTGSDKNRAENTRRQLVSELVAKAWELRVVHPDYAELYGELEDLEQKRTALQEQMRSCEQRLQNARQTRTQTDAEYAARINRLQEERTNASARLTKIRADKSALEKRLSKLQVDQQKTQTEIQTLRDKLAQQQSSLTSDQGTQTASLSNAIAALERSLVQIANDVPRLQSEISQLSADETSLANDLERLEKQILNLQSEQREALTPLDRQIAALQEEIRTHNKQIAELTQRMAPLISNLGPMVDRVRPDSPTLEPLYAQIDRAGDELSKLQQQQEVLQARLAATDAAAVRNFYIAIGSFSLALITIAVLVAAAFS
ncbi:MAG: hypothetical protein NZ699_17230 [Roseiflexus sp.]|nr:hypothetical protein [Roseiflexus sp.]